MLDTNILLNFETVQSVYVFGETLQFFCQVTNHRERPIFVARDRLFPSVYGHRLELLVGQSEIVPGLKYFAYNPPQLVQLDSGKTSTFDLRVGMPIEEVSANESGRALYKQIPLSGEVGVVLRLCYLEQEFRPHTADPLGEFVSAMHQIESKPISLTIGAPAT